MGKAAETPETSGAARAESPFWRTGAAGRESSRLGRGPRGGRLPDEPGGRCHRDNLGGNERGGDHDSSDGGAVGVGREAWNSQGTVRGLEERISNPARANAGGAVKRAVAPHAIRKGLQEAGSGDHTSELPSGQGTRGTQAWGISGPMGERTPTGRPAGPAERQSPLARLC